MFGDKDYDTSISRAMLSLRDVLGAPPPGVAQKPMGMPPGQQPQMPQQQPQMPQQQPQMPQQQQNGQGAALAQLMQRMHMPQPGQMTNGPLSRAMSPGQMPRSFAEGGRVQLEDFDPVRYAVGKVNRMLGPSGLAVHGGYNVDNRRGPGMAYGSIGRDFELPGGGLLSVEGRADKVGKYAPSLSGHIGARYDAEKLYDLLSK